MDARGFLGDPQSDLVSRAECRDRTRAPLARLVMSEGSNSTRPFDDPRIRDGFFALAQIIHEGSNRSVADYAENRTYELKRLIDYFTHCFSQLLGQMRQEFFEETRNPGID